MRTGFRNIFASNYARPKYVHPSRDKRNNEFNNHRRIGSISTKPPSNLNTIQNPNAVSSKNNGLAKNYYRGRIRTEKQTPTVSPKVATIKSLLLSEIYSARHLTHRHSKLNNTTLRSGHLASQERHGSIESQPRIKIQNMSFLIPASNRHKKNSINFFSKRNSENYLDVLNKGLDNLKLKNFREAIDCFDKVINTSPNSPEAYFHRGIAFFESEANTKALKDFEKIAEEWPKYNKSVYLYLSMIYTKILDYNSAISSVIFNLSNS